MAGVWNCIIIDDEIAAAKLLEGYIENMPGMAVFKTYNNPLQALAEISSDEEIDFIFLAIEMAEITGLELAEALRGRTKFLIFTTAHTEFAFRAFEVNADQYLLKPIMMSKFALVVNRLLKSRFAQHDVSGLRETTRDEFFIKADQKNKLIRINPAEIIAIEGFDNYVKIHTASGQIVAYLTIKELEAKFRGDNAFIRVQKSFMVAKYYIDHVDGHLIHCTNGMVIPIGLMYKAAFIAYLKQNTFQSARKAGR